MFHWATLGSVFGCCGLGPLVVPAQSRLWPGPGLFASGKEETVVSACQMAVMPLGCTLMTLHRHELPPPQTAHKRF